VAKDDFNFDDFQYSGVKLPKQTPAAEEAPVEAIEAVEAVEPMAAVVAAEPLAAEAVAAPVVEKSKAKAPKAVKVKRESSPFSKKLAQSNPFIVILGITLVALLLAVIFLAVELMRYDLDIHATQGKHGITMNSPIKSKTPAYYCRAEGRLEIAGDSIV
jgi:hypothetical protein